jgi:hypothetical protein
VGGSGWLVYELTGLKLALGTVSFAGSIPTLFLMLRSGVLMTAPNDAFSW